MAVESFNLNSSNVERAEYDEDSHELRVWFHNGGPYLVEGVDPSDVQAFKTSPSPGRFWNENFAEDAQ